MMKSKELFLLQQRFDLMFKYLYVKYQEKYGEKTDFFKKLYFDNLINEPHYLKIYTIPYNRNTWFTFCQDSFQTYF